MPLHRDRCRARSGTRRPPWRLPRLSPWLACVAFLHATTTAATPPSTAPAPQQPALGLDIQRLTLPNGLRVVLLPDHTSPTVAIDVAYDVGGRNEERGRAGFARLVEHMMFQGSKNVPRGGHRELVAARGGVANGTAREDRTDYVEMLPSSELALGLWLEADRMTSLDVSPTNFESQRAVVEEEHRAQVQSAAYVPASIRLQSLVYRGYWPYEHSAIGTARDLAGARLSWVRAFYEAYYAPDNAVLAIAGDIDPAETLDLVKRYFGDVRRGAPRPVFAPPPLPVQTEERAAVVVDEHAELPALLEGWAIPKTGDKDNDALILASMLLADGESSRLRRVLVRERAVAVGVAATTDGFRGPDMFEVVVHLASGASLPLVKTLVETQIAELARLGPTDEELLKVRRRFRAKFLLGLESNVARARAMAEHAMYRGDDARLDEALERLMTIGKADIQRAVGTYLTAPRRSVVEVRPASGEGRR